MSSSACEENIGVQGTLGHCMVKLNVGLCYHQCFVLFKLFTLSSSSSSHLRLLAIHFVQEQHQLCHQSLWLIKMY